MTTDNAHYQLTVRPQTIYGGRERVVLIDLGVRETLISWLAHRGCRITIIGLVSCQRVLNLDPSMVILAGNGACSHLTDAAADLIRQIAPTVPVFGAGIGMEAVVTAFSGELEQLLEPHEGDYPVLNLGNKQSFVSNQQHHVAVYEHGLKGTDLITLQLNAIDRSVEAVRHAELPVSAVHYNPECGDRSAAVELMRLLDSTERRDGSVSPVCYSSIPR